MKLLLDFFPILLFFGAFKLTDIYTATGVLMAATAVQMTIIWFRHRRLEPMQKATLVLILLFGTLTLALHDERFIKWKPTVLYGAMAIALAIAWWGLNKNFLKMLLGGQLELPEAMAQGAQMIELARERPSALLCFEREPAHCHRSLLLEAVAPDIEAVHLFA